MMSIYLLLDLKRETTRKIYYISISVRLANILILGFIRTSNSANKILFELLGLRKSNLQQILNR